MKAYMITTFWTVWWSNTLLLIGIILINLGIITAIQLGYQLTWGTQKHD